MAKTSEHSSLNGKVYLTFKTEGRWVCLVVWIARAVLTFVHQGLQWLSLLGNSALLPFAL